MPQNTITMTTPRRIEAQPAEDWVGRHSDAYHPGSRDECDHCQLMIHTFGPMPPAAEILEADRRRCNSRKGARG